MQELVSDYILLEDFFMSNNIKKALDQHQSEMAAQQVKLFKIENCFIILCQDLLKWHMKLILL